MSNLPKDPNTGHGHVFPRPDGVKARCGGPGMCAECSRDLARKNATPHTSDCAANNAPALPVGPCDCGVLTSKKESRRYMCIRVLQDDGETERPAHFRVVDANDFDEATAEIERLTAERNTALQAAQINAEQCSEKVARNLELEGALVSVQECISHQDFMRVRRVVLAALSGEPSPVETADKHRVRADQYAYVMEQIRDHSTDPWAKGIAASCLARSPLETSEECGAGVGGVTLAQMAENMKLGLDPYTGDSSVKASCEHRNQRQGELGPSYCADCGAEVPFGLRPV